jgi:hypothetical protein
MIPFSTDEIESAMLRKAILNFEVIGFEHVSMEFLNDVSSILCTCTF